MKILDIIGKLGPIFTFIAVVMAYVTLRDNHEWNRRNYAAQMISNWNRQTKQVIDEIEKIEPRMIDFHPDGSLVQMNSKRAEAIYYSRYPQDSSDWVLRTKFIHLLNEFEFIASSYENGVADKKMLADSFKDIFVKWGYVLKNFIDIYKHQRSTATPWGPYHGLYDTWSRESPNIVVKERDETGTLVPF